MARKAEAASRTWIRSVVERYEGPLIRYAARLAGDVEVARDAVQETFLALIRADPAEVRHHVAPWLFAVCRNRTLDLRRKEKRMDSLDEEHLALRVATTPSPVVLVEGKEAAGRLLAVIESLPEREREVVRLKFQEGLRYREISEVMGISVSNVGFLIHTATKTLRKRLADGTDKEK